MILPIKITYNKTKGAYSGEKAYNTKTKLSYNRMNGVTITLMTIERYYDVTFDNDTQTEYTLNTSKLPN